MSRDVLFLLLADESSAVKIPTWLQRRLSTHAWLPVAHWECSSLSRSIMLPNDVRALSDYNIWEESHLCTYRLQMRDFTRQFLVTLPLQLVLFNRRPSLHKMSMMSHRVKTMPYSSKSTLVRCIFEFWSNSPQHSVSNFLCKLKMNPCRLSINFDLTERHLTARISTDMKWICSESLFPSACCILWYRVSVYLKVKKRGPS